jgi:DNA-binding NarL/FixJ family response regulator
MNYRVIIVEDDPAMRRELCDKVAQHPALQVVSAAGTLQDGRDALAQYDCDVVLVDLGLPDGDGTDLIRAAAAMGRDVMTITVFGDDRHVIGAIEAGATGYLLKDADAEGIGEAIVQLIDGGSPISPSIARRLLMRFRDTPGEACHSATDAVRLTNREVEVLQMVSRGLTNNEIADMLSMSFHTVASHIKHIYRKLAVTSRSEAVFEAVSQGIIRLNKD